MDRGRVQEDLSVSGANSREGQRPIKLPPFVKCLESGRGSQDCFIQVCDSGNALLEKMMISLTYFI